MTDKTRLEAADQAAFLFMATTPSKVSKVAEGEQRKFEGVAYSGQVIANHWWWGNVIFDLDTMTVPEPLGMLLDHRTDQRAGVATSHKISYEKGLELSGVLTRNEFGQAVAADSDDGFPWQQSVFIAPNRIEEIEQGTVVVNGQVHQAPITIFRDSVVRETSFCALGQDSQTSAKAFSLRNTNPTTAKAFSKGDNQEGDPMDLQQAQARISELEGQLTAVTAERDKFSKTARTEQIKGLFAVIGREYKEDDADVLAFAALPDAGFEATAKMLREQFSKQTQSAKPNVPAHLFSHQANGGKADGNGEHQFTAGAKAFAAKK
ncbi:MAG: hypothetical protein VXW65_01220 [Pseudomonadota bacterium]|nr:hypothetical protein [Pseudomonadota bacterium]